MLMILITKYFKYNIGNYKIQNVRCYLNYKVNCLIIIQVTVIILKTIVRIKKI